MGRWGGAADSTAAKSRINHEAVELCRPSLSGSLALISVWHSDFLYFVGLMRHLPVFFRSYFLGLYSPVHHATSTQFHRKATHFFF